MLLACSVHKWLHGAHGFSLLYVDPKVQPQLAPLEHHERNRAGSEMAAWDDVGAMTHAGYPTAYLPGARRYSVVPLHRKCPCTPCFCRRPSLTLVSIFCF